MFCDTACYPGDFTIFIPDVSPYNGTTKTARNGNAISHQRDGQNVLFLDGRVIFEHRSSCGLDNDNIYTKAKGTSASSSTCQPMNERDSLLVHDPPMFAQTSQTR
jgi:hypothetical protein